MEPPRRYLDQPWLGVLLDLEHILHLLRPLMRHQASPLPHRLRTRLATAFMRVAAVRRELTRWPEAVLHERDREDAPPTGREDDPDPPPWDRKP